MTTGAGQEVAAAELVRPAWKRLRIWLVLVLVVAVGAVLLGTLLENPSSPLDPTSTRDDGSRALVRVLDGYGVTVSHTTRLDTALDERSAAILVTSPDDYSDAQLRRLTSSSHRVLLVQPGTRASAAALPGLSPDAGADASSTPGCGDEGARAAGSVDPPGDTIPYDVGTSGAVSCYGGAVVVTPHLVVLGSAQLLQNHTLADDGVAALDVNALSDSRDLDRVVWLLPGGDAGGSGPASIWDLFPDGVYRGFWFVVAFGVLLVVWRARRLGGVVREPLPVVVRSAEVVEGHGRLYLRAGARDRAATALRTSATSRIAARLALPRGTRADQVALAAAPAAARPAAEVTALLTGPTPDDDAALVRLAAELDRLEAGLGVTTERNTT